MRAFKMWSWTLGKKCRIVRFRWGKRRGVWSPCSKYQLQLQASEDHSWGYIGGSCSQEKKSWIWFELGNSVVIWGWEQSSHHSQHHLVLLRPIIELCLLAHLKHIWVPLKPPPRASVLITPHAFWPPCCDRAPRLLATSSLEGVTAIKWPPSLPHLCTFKPPLPPIRMLLQRANVMQGETFHGFKLFLSSPFKDSWLISVYLAQSTTWKLIIVVATEMFILDSRIKL